VLAFVMMPIVFTGMALFLEELGGIEIPAAAMITELLKILLVPILLGMTIRYLRPEIKTRHDRLLKRLSMLALVALLAALVWKSSGIFFTTISDTVLVSTAFAMTLMLLGIGVGVVCRLKADDLFTLLIEFTVRNVAIAIVIAVTVLQNVEFAVFGTAYFLAQVPIILGVITVFRFRRRYHSWSSRVMESIIQEPEETSPENTLEISE
jgi:BASS family bile acid:Na+ symporter